MFCPSLMDYIYFFRQTDFLCICHPMGMLSINTQKALFAAYNNNLCLFAVASYSIWSFLPPSISQAANHVAQKAKLPQKCSVQTNVPFGRTVRPFLGRTVRFGVRPNPDFIRTFLRTFSKRCQSRYCRFFSKVYLKNSL